MTRLSGIDGPSIGLPIGDRRARVHIQAYPRAGGFTYLAPVRGMTAMQNPLAIKKKFLENNRVFTIQVAVRVADSKTAKVAAGVGGKSLFVWEGPLSDLSADDKHFIDLESNRARAVFHSVRFRLLSGEVSRIK